MSDLVDWLRDLDRSRATEAANEIEHLRAENERLREQCNGLAQAAMNNGQDLLLKEREIERLRAENERLQLGGVTE
jgi:hypothetical protein